MSLKFEMLEEKLGSRIDAMFGVKDALIEVHPGRVLLPPKFQDIGQRIRDFHVKPDDVWMVAYPRTGSTWTLEMVWCLMNNLDFEAAKSTLINFRSPIIELSALFGHDNGEVTSVIPDSVRLVESIPSPRCIRTHLPLQLLPQELRQVKPKIVYVARNPKDVCVSYYHYCLLLHNLQDCSFEDFCELFLQGKAPVGPYLDHVLEFWKLRNEPNVLFLKYEDMKKDHRAAVAKIAEFLGKELTEEQVTSLIDHASFKKMRENPSVNLQPIMEQMHGPGHEVKEEIKFIRKGEVGDWRNHMSDEMSRRFDEWSTQRLEGSGLTFDST
ncbi:sulfotransferase 1E1 [Macrosteles quadrilineatus]|uniref:sulfotransferase 1E1 n=1 Tax=Macrosteles quadrilineatus TaxID=74068 RepID=UPI0023E1CDF9|nr:sulfotransferase 1E1 [Macrosteles quadrilineatus]